jgi:hypothetical protein
MKIGGMLLQKDVYTGKAVVARVSGDFAIDGYSTVRSDVNIFSSKIWISTRR